MAVGGGGVSHLFWVPPVTAGDVASWVAPGVLGDGGGGGGGGMTIGGAVVGGTPGSVLFIGAGGILAQDNANFFWDDTNFNLKINASATGQGAFFTGGLPALFVVPNGSGNNWFEDNSGNFTCTGHSNLGTGDGALAAVTSGFTNTAFGANALANLTTGNNNFAFGSSALLHSNGNSNVAIGGSALAANTTASNNLVIGASSLRSLDNPGNDFANVAVGPTIAGNATIGYANTLIGFQAFNSTTNLNTNVGIGVNCASNMSTAAQNTFIGPDIAFNLTGNCQNNTWFGAYQGTAVSYNNTILIADGTGFLNGVDYSITTSQVWSYNRGATPLGVHIYNTTDRALPPVNFERGVLDWNITSNVFTIGTPASSAGGTGTLRETRLYTKGLPAIFTVTNASGNNWFEGNAGNFTLTGSGNFGTGDTVLASLTTGSGNLAMGGIDASSPYGISTAASITTGGHAATGNVALGASALCQLQSGQGNVAVGARALEATVFDQLNVAIAPQAMPKLGAGGAGSGGNSGNIAIGNAAFGNLSTATNMVAIGDSAAQNIVSSASGGDVFVGANAGNGLSSSAGFNTMIGNAAGFSITSGSNNTILGGWLGTATAISNVIAFSHGINHPSLDFNYTISNIWSFLQSTSPVGIHVYNTTDNGAPPTNYERAVLDWNITANVFTVGVPPSGAGGTGTLRDVYYYSAGLLSLYRVPNASGDNWFEGDAGNTSVTGSNNFGTGHQCMVALTSGSNNTAVGTQALKNLTTGTGNFAFGTQALLHVTSGVNNVAVGPNVLQSGSIILDNTGIGSAVLSALGDLGNASQGNVAIGRGIAQNLDDGSDNIFIGDTVAHALTGTGNNNNIFLGADCANAMTGGSNNTWVGGAFCGFNFTSGNQNTLLGMWRGAAASVSNIIAISDGSNPAAAQMDFNYTASNVWSLQLATTPIGLHIYNTTDTPPANYERLCLDWNLTSNVFRIASQKGGTGTVRLIAIDGFQKAGAPAAGDLPSGTCALINDTSGGNTWLVYNNSGTIRKVQLT